MQRPRVQAPPPPVEPDPVATDGATGIPVRALPPAVMQESPWVAGGRTKTTGGAATRSGVGGTVLTAPGGLVSPTDTNLRGKTLLGS